MLYLKKEHVTYLVEHKLKNAKKHYDFSVDIYSIFQNKDQSESDKQFSETI